MRTENLSCKVPEQKQAVRMLAGQIMENSRNELLGAYPSMEGVFASLEPVFEEGCRQIGTDGTRLFVSPYFILRTYERDPASVRRGYLHILLHCLYLHPFCPVQADKTAWNLACDLAVEQILDREEDPCIRGDFAARRQKKMWIGTGMHSVMELYGMLMEQFTSEERREMETLYAFDDHTFWKKSAGEREEQIKKWMRIMQYTTKGTERTLHRAGTDKGKKSEDLLNISHGKYDYRAFLRRFCERQEEQALDMESFDYIFYTYGMEHYHQMPFIEPLEYQEANRLAQLVIAIDTSGSCTTEIVRRFLEETFSILSAQEHFFKKMEVHIVQCDCWVQDVKVIHSEEEWRAYARAIRVQGRGGTDFCPVFRYIAGQQAQGELKNLKAMIYFTDGDGIYPKEQPGYDAAFVFLKRCDSMKYVPPWAYRLVVDG